MDVHEEAPTPLEAKLKTLLQLILTRNISYQNDTYFSKFITHLCERNEQGDSLLHSEAVVAWIPKALAHWENGKLPNLNLSSFLLNLTAKVSHNEATFISYNLADVYQRLFSLFKHKQIEPTIKLAFVQILSAALNHQSGLEWVISNNYWKECLNFCLEQQTIYIIKEGHTFLYNLLKQTADKHKEFCMLVLEEIYSHLEAQPGTATVPVFHQLVTTNLLAAKCTPALHLILFVLNKLIENECKVNDYQLVRLMLAHNTLEDHVRKLQPYANTVESVYDLYAVLVYARVLRLLVANDRESYYERCYKAGGDILDFIKDLTSVRYIVTVIRLSHLADTLWNYVQRQPHSPPPVAIEHGRREPFRFKDQLLIFQVAPMFGICIIHTEMYRVEMKDDDIREDFITAFINAMHQRTIRMAYAWRDVVAQQTDGGFETARLAIQHVVRSIGNYEKDRAIWVFQMMLYTLRDTIGGLKERPTLIDLFVTNASCMTALFDAMAVFINTYDISWRDSVETIMVMNCAVECINQTFWPPRVIVHALKLVDLSIAKFLPPDLALLVEEDSTTHMLGSMLTSKLYDIHWEVRDSTLEILHTIAKISNSKYPLFQTMLLNVDIIPMIVTMTRNDSEGFVRASAIKCLQEMLQVHDIWTHMLVNQELPQKMMHILKYDTEAIVRTEAAKLMSNIHEYQSFPKDLMPQIYESMALAASRDLHWEVKANAINFWGKVVLNHLQDQGYIDGKFPNVTFSKEQRKIVTLTEEEVQRRLDKVLHQLAEIGCLGVMVYAAHDDCDIQVSKMACEKLGRFKTLLQERHLLERYAHVPLPAQAPCTAPTTPVTPPKIAFSEATINRLLDTNDISLLPGILTSDEPSCLYVEQTSQIRSQLQITPDMFVTFIRNDLDALAAEKEKWLTKLDDFESLLDDMSRSYKPDVNSMDCY